MSSDFPIREEGGPASPKISMALVADKALLGIECAYWPVKDSEYSVCAHAPLDALFAQFIAMNIVPDGTATSAHRYGLLEGLAGVRAALDRAVAQVKLLPLRAGEEFTGELTEDGNPATTTNLAEQTCFDLAEEIDALYVTEPLGAGSLDRRAQVQVRLQQVINPLQTHAAICQRVKRAMSPVSREIWGNGCATRAPEALRFLADHDRPMGGEQYFNSAHLFQLADEIEAAVKATCARAAIDGKRDWVTCPICKEEDMERITVDKEGGSVIRCLNLCCASNQAIVAK